MLCMADCSQMAAFGAFRVPTDAASTQSGLLNDPQGAARAVKRSALGFGVSARHFRQAL